MGTIEIFVSMGKDVYYLAELGQVSQFPKKKNLKADHTQLSFFEIQTELANLPNFPAKFCKN